MRWLRALLPVLLVVVPTHAGAADQPMSAFAANVGAHGVGDSAAAATLYVVPDGRTLLVTDILVANHGMEAGPLLLADSKGTRCSVQLLQTTLVNGGAGTFGTLANAHTTFSSGLPFGPGEPVLATLVGGSKGVDVTITGKLVPGPRRGTTIRLPGGARDAPDDAPTP